MFSLIMAYDKLKTFYSTKLFDLKFQMDHVNPKKKWLSEKYDDDPTDTNIYVILIKLWEMKWFRPEIKWLELSLYKMIILKLEDFVKNYNVNDDTMNESD